MSILESENAKNWLRQFDLNDQALAADLLSRFVFVSGDDLRTGLRDLVLDSAKLVEGPVGLYAERGLGKGEPPPQLFEETDGNVRRAIGGGPGAVEPATKYGHEIGSEGLIAALITQLTRQHPERFFSHPGPDVIRQECIRHLWVLSDLIASGSRARKYLDAFWRVRSVRSWWSGKYIRLGVLAYAATPRGAKKVSRHASKPAVAYVMPCPTIVTAFSSDKTRYESLCEKYNPTDFRGEGIFRERWSLGYDNTGALIAFAHGAPNNTPRMFYETGPARPGWIPLFPHRVTAEIDAGYFGQKLANISERLERLGQRVLAKSPISAGASVEVKKRFLILAAVAHGYRRREALAQATGLTFPEVDSVCVELEGLGWLSRLRLTDAGYAELRQARRQTEADYRALIPSIDESERDLYYPVSLRPPVIKPS